MHGATQCCTKMLHPFGQGFSFGSMHVRASLAFSFSAGVALGEAESTNIRDTELFGQTVSDWSRQPLICMLKKMKKGDNLSKQGLVVRLR